MLTVNVHEAKSQLSKLLEAVEAGQEVTIARGGRPVARLVGLRDKPPPRRLGGLIGQLNIPEAFDAPLPDDVLALFQGDPGKPRAAPATALGPDQPATDVPAARR